MHMNSQENFDTVRTVWKKQFFHIQIFTMKLSIQRDIGVRTDTPKMEQSKKNIHANLVYAKKALKITRKGVAVHKWCGDKITHSAKIKNKKLS